MSKKTESAYTALFNKILSFEPEWNPQTIIIDFEQALMLSVRMLFPYSTIQGSWFHFSRIIWREVQNIGKLTYNNHMQFHKYCAFVVRVFPPKMRFCYYGMIVFKLLEY